MPVPRNTGELFAAHNGWRLPGDAESICQGSRHHSPVPMFTHPVPLVPPEWDRAASDDSEQIFLCGVCRDNLAAFSQVLFRGRGKVPWSIAREFGNQIRSLGHDAYAAYLLAR